MTVHKKIIEKFDFLQNDKCLDQINSSIIENILKPIQKEPQIVETCLKSVCQTQTIQCIGDKDCEEKFAILLKFYETLFQMSSKQSTLITNSIILKCLDISFTLLMLNPASMSSIEKLIDLLEKSKTQLMAEKACKIDLLYLTNKLITRLDELNQYILKGRVLLLVAFILPQNERSGVNLFGDIQDTEQSIDSKIEFQIEKRESTPVVIDYKLYSLFWNVILETINGTKKGNYTSVNSVIKTIKEFSAQESSYSSSSELSFSPKSRLFPLQLEDSSFRRFVLLQLSFYLSSDKGLNDLGKKDADHLQRKVIKLLKSKYNLSLDKLLSSESKLVAWKKAKCPKLSNDAKYQTDINFISPTEAKGKKRKLDNPLLDETPDDVDFNGKFVWSDRLSDWETEYQASDELKETNILNKELEALDPKNAIEKEYRPSNTELWRWKAMRQVSRSCSLEQMNQSQGKIANLCQMIYSKSNDKK